MRRISHLLVPFAVVTVLTAGLAAPALADWDGPGLPGDRSAVSTPRTSARAALTEVRRLFSGTSSSANDREATLALRELWLKRSSLSVADRAAADAFLARPTDPGDPSRHYTVPEATPVCGPDVCVHYVTSTPDRATPEFAQITLDTLESVHSAYVAAGYRPPKPDGALGGDARTDIYLADVGGDGLYGYCTSDEPPSSASDVWAFCVVDNDYAALQFGTRNTPTQNLQVTAAHEYFHAVQFGYDVAEDAWFMEATATWVEDELYDSVNDNVGYLDSGQLGESLYPLDYFAGSIHYGNWIFFRYLTERFSTSAGGMPVLVRTLWRYADAAPGADDQYSTQAIRTALAAKGLSFTKAFAQFSAVNRFSRTWYDEGRVQRYPQADILSRITLTKARRHSTWLRGRIHHLTSYSARATPKGLKGPWRLKVSVNMGNSLHARAVVVDQVRRNGRHAPVRLVRLNRKGVGKLRVPFSNAKTSSVVITLVNAGIRYRCWEGSDFACGGTSLDNNQPIALKVDAVK